MIRGLVSIVGLLLASLWFGSFVPAEECSENLTFESSVCPGFLHILDRSLLGHPYAQSLNEVVDSLTDSLVWIVVVGALSGGRTGAIVHALPSVPSSPVP